MKGTVNSTWWLLLPIAFYLIGLFLCPPEDVRTLKKQGYAEQEGYTWTDSEGEEHEGVSLLHINAIGNVLTYRYVYISVILLFIPFLVIGRMLYGEHQDEFATIIFGNCVIGLALIALSTKCHIASTTLYWVGIISANYINNHFKHE